MNLRPMRSERSDPGYLLGSAHVGDLSGVESRLKSDTSSAICSEGLRPAEIESDAVWARGRNAAVRD
jgi:hypothetical protein